MAKLIANLLITFMLVLKDCEIKACGKTIFDARTITFKKIYSYMLSC